MLPLSANLFSHWSIPLKLNCFPFVILLGLFAVPALSTDSRGPRSSSFWLPQNLSSHMVGQARTHDTVFVKRREMTGRSQTLPWWWAGSTGCWPPSPIPLKGQCHEIFGFWYFSSISFPPAPEYPIRPFPILSKIRGEIRSSRLTTGVVDTGGKWKKSSIRKILIIGLGHLWIVELTYIYIFAFKFTLRYLQPDINPIVCHRCRWHRWQICHRYQQH